jgi:hypothetical protein
LNANKNEWVGTLVLQVPRLRKRAPYKNKWLQCPKKRKRCKRKSEAIGEQRERQNTREKKHTAAGTKLSKRSERGSVAVGGEACKEG